MDIQQYASDPSDPLWEEPSWRKVHCHTINFHHAHHGDDDEGKDNVGSMESHEPVQESPRKKALDEAAGTFTLLCGSDAPVAEILDFLAKWEDPPSSGRIQPNALAWFNDTNAVQLVCSNDNRVLLRILLEKGLKPTVRAAAGAKAKWQETKNKDALQLLVDYGLDVNQPINDNTPPIMRLVL